jgi:hypothetical protein
MFLIRVVIMKPDSAKITAADANIASLGGFELGRGYVPCGHAAWRSPVIPDHFKIQMFPKFSVSAHLLYGFHWFASKSLSFPQLSAYPKVA